MAELYAKPFETIETGYNPQQPQGGGQSSEADEYLSSLPPEERQAAIQRLNAPLTGEELATLAQSGQKQPSLAEFAEIEKFHKNHEISFIDGLGKIAEGGEQFMSDISKAFGAMIDNPSDVASKMPATAVEAFAQGTRNFYGMLAESSNTNSTLFKVKDFLNGTGTIEDRYNQYIQALKFNKDSMELMEGKQTMVMDADMINHEVTQAMAYIADPTLFIPFGKVASTGLRAVGLGEKLAMAGARSAAIKNGIIGNTIKWGVGQPLEFMGGAVRNTIDFGLEKAGAALETTTGIGAKEFAQTARMSGIGFSASAVAGYSIPFASTVSDAYIVGSSARGFGEAITLVGETMKKNKFGRGINSWAAEALEQAEKSGTVLSPHAKGLLKTLNAVDPLFAYGWNGLEGASQGALIGGGLGYLNAGEEGMYSGIGAGIAMGAVGGTAGKVVADVTGGTNIARRAVQAKMVIEGHKVTNPDKAMFFQAMQTTAEARGQDVDLVNGIIAGIDKVAPNFEFHALTPEQFYNEAKRKGYDPTTGKFKELSALDSEFGGDRASKSKAVSILRSVGGDFVGDRTAFLDALKKASAKDSANPNKPARNIPLNLRKYTDVAKTFEKLTKTQQEAVLKEIDGQGDIAKELGGNTKLRDYYDTLTWAEGWTDQLVKKFETDREGSRKDITEMLAQETGKDGKLNRKGRALADKLRAEGFLDRDNKLLRERNLLQADLTISQFAFSKGAVIGRESDGKTHMYINLNSMGNETFPHELFHTIMRESPMKKYFTDSLISKLLGTVDKDGKLVRPAEVNIGQVQKFFKKYIDLTHRNDDGTLDAQASEAKFKLVQEALTEYQNAGSNKQISDKARGLLENYSEEFGAYYFSHWLMGRNRNTLFFGGELKGIEGLVERTKDSFKDFWQSKISKSNPEFDFSKGLNESFDRSKGLGRIASVDYYMRDMVRAASNANREAFRPDAMTLDNLKDFERSNGLRNLTTVDGNRRLNPREQVTQNIRLGKEAFKILSGVDKAMRTSKDVVDENGKQVITGRLSETELDALVKGGIVPRAWADKVNQGYAMLDGTISNVFSAGYLGKTEQTTDASYPRLTGRDVAFKNRKAVLFDVETKIKADGTFYTLFHTLDLAVIEQEANRLFQNTDYRALFDGDRAVMEADFFRYLSNASRASTDPKKLDSAALLEKGDGLGAQRRDVLHQMGRMALQTGDAYKHQPIAVIPEGFRHSVTTFNIDGMTMPRVETGSRYDINMKNAHKFIRENWQPDEMKQEKTPTGVVMTHETGFKFTKDASGRVSAYTDDGSKVGTFGSIKEATTASKNLYNKAQDNIRKIAQVAKQKEVESRKNLQPLDEAFYEEAFRVGDMFKTKRMQEIVGNSRLVRQTFDEFLGQKVEEINSGKNEQEKGAILAKLFNSEFKELIDLEAELKKTYDEFGLEASQLQAQETEITKRIVEFSQEKQRLQESGNPEAKVDIGILDMYGRIYRRKEEVNKRLSEIANKMHNEGITDLNSHYYITKRFLERFKETGELGEEAIKFVLAPRLIKEYEANFETGKAVTFLANHGTPNHELIVSKTFNTEFLGRNTGSLSAFNATFFAGSKETSLAFVGVPLAKTWVRDFIQARPHYVKEFSPELVAKLESMLSSDTSKGVVQKVKYLMKNAHIEFPDDFKLKDTHRKTKEGEPIIASRPESTLGYKIDTLLDRMLENANDEGAVFGGVETYWEEAGRKPYLLRNIVKMDNPLVHEYAKADYRDETFASVIQRAKDAGHDGVIFKNTKDGGGLDTIFASFAKNEDNKIFTLETTEDTRFVPRGNDEAGNKIKNGSEIEGRNYQPTDEAEGEQGGRTYKDFQMGGRFIGKYAQENPSITKDLTVEYYSNDTSDFKDVDGTKWRVVLKDKNGFDIGDIAFEYEERGRFFNGTEDVDGLVVRDISVHIGDPANRGKNYQHLLYSEMFERARATGAIGFTQNIENKIGIPLKSINRVVGKDSSKIWTLRDYEAVDTTQENFDRLMSNAPKMRSGKGLSVEFVQNNGRLDPNARYQPTEAPLVDAVEMAEARRLGDLFKTKQMREFVGDRKVVPQTADEGFTDFINNFKQADINQDTALMMLDEMSKDMFGGLDRQTLKLKYNELIEKTLPAYFKKYPREKEYFERAKLNRGNDYTFSPEKHEVNLFTRLMSIEDANQFIRMYRELENPVAEKQRHSGFTRETAETFAKKIKEARKWVNNAMPSYNDFAGYLADNVPMREYYQHAVYSKKFRTGEPVVVVGVHGTYTSQGFLKDKKYKHDLRTKDLPLSEGEQRGAYFAASDATVLSSEYQGYDPKKLGYEISQDFRRPESDTPNIAKSAIRFDNPLVVDGQQTAVMKRTEKILGEAIAAGHDGVIYINQKDGGGLDVSFILPIETANKQQRMIGSTLEKTMAGEAYEPLPRGEGLTNRTANLQPTEGEQGSRVYTDKQMSSEFIGRYAAENAKVTKGLKPKFNIFTSGDQGNIELMKGQDSIGYINFSFSKATGDALIEYTSVAGKQQGKGYGNLLYSELVERLRSMGMKEVQGMIIDERGRPQKIRERIIDRENARIGGDRTQIDYVDKDPDSGDTHTGVTSYLYNKAWYQPDEKIGTQSSNVKLLLEGMKSGRILRTVSYKGLGLEDSLLIAHTPDTAKIGQVTAGNKALADLQGGIFYAIANGNRIWASNFAGEGETNILVQFAKDQLQQNANGKTYIMLVKADNSKIFASVDGARGVSNIFKHLNDSGVMTDLRYNRALKNSAEMHLRMKGLDGLSKDELYARIDDALLRSKENKISFENRADFTREIARQLNEAGAFDSKKSKDALVKSFHKGFERGFSIVEMERVFGNLMAEDIIKDVPKGHVYGAIEITNPLRETKKSDHRGYDASIEQESGEPSKLIMFDRTAHVTEIVNKKSGDEISMFKAGEGAYHSYTGGQIPYQEVRGKKQMPFQPTEYSEFKSEQSATGRILRNAKGYVIMLANNKFRVYNPAKAIIGVYGNEEEAKKRIYKEIPKR